MVAARGCAFDQTYWQNPDDLNALRVWADALTEQADPRGEFINLSLLDSADARQQARREALKKKLGGKLVGPARPFLRTWQLGAQGLVTSVVTEASKFVLGFDQIAALHPRLMATVTAVRKAETIAQMSTLALHRIHFLLLEWNALSDAALTTLGPALSGVQNLSLAFNPVSARALRAVAPHLESLEYLALGAALKQLPDEVQISREWVEVLCENRAFHNLRAVHLFSYHRAPSAAELDRLWRLPRMKSVTVGEPLYYSSDSIAAFKRGAHVAHALR